jgi:hypothetical protein
MVDDAFAPVPKTFTEPRPGVGPYRSSGADSTDVVARSNSADVIPSKKSLNGHAVGILVPASTNTSRSKTGRNASSMSRAPVAGRLTYSAMENLIVWMREGDEQRRAA